jgi:hypothetical protein
MRAIPPAYLPRDACLVLITTDENLFGRPDLVSGTLDGVFETLWSATGAVHMAYRRLDLSVAICWRWGAPEFRSTPGQGPGPRGLAINNQPVVPEHSVIYAWGSNGGSVIEDLTLRQGDGSAPRVIHFPIAECLRRHGHPTIALAVNDAAPPGQDSLLATMDRAEKTQPSWVGTARFRIGEDERLVLLQHPAPPPAVCAIRWRKLRIPPRAALCFGITLSPDLWGKEGSGDGVEFAVDAEQGGQRVNLFHCYIDPKNDPADRHWFDVELPLTRFGGQTIDLVLTTLPGPKGDITCDHAGWSGLRITPAETGPRGECNGQGCVPLAH